MRALCTAVLAVSLAGCAMTEHYQTAPVAGDPKAIVERVLAEQPPKFHPDYVKVTDEYVEYGGATYTKQQFIGTNKSRRPVHLRLGGPAQDGPADARRLMCAVHTPCVQQA